MSIAIERGTWRLDLRSRLPVHPTRFQHELAAIADGPYRSRGCFWLPTRPDVVCAWDAAGGQASVGSDQAWGHSEPITRITVIGLDRHDARADIEAAFRRCLLTEAEIGARGKAWKEAWDGFEPWLGPIEYVV